MPNVKRAVAAVGALARIRARRLTGAVTERKVDFIIAGTQKGGTTALDLYLRGHPALCLADRKEVHFFDDESSFAGGKVDYSVYHSYFNPKPRHELIGEATPIYMYWNDAPRRIFEYNPAVKLIVMLRNPINRAFSHWNMEHGRGADPLSFWDALQSEPERCLEAAPLQHRVFSYIDRGRYAQQLRRLWSFFPKEQVLVLRNEDLKRDPVAVLGRICDFLGVAPLGRVVSKGGEASYPQKMTERERALLLRVFEPEIRDLERTLGWDCSAWLQ